MRKIGLFFLTLIAIALLLAWFVSRPQAQYRPVVVAAADLPAGHIIQEPDLRVVNLPPASIPEGAFATPDDLIGQPVRVARTAGDILTTAHLGEEHLPLLPNEREVGVTVTDAAGLAGTLKPGDRVGVTAVLLRTENTSNVYAKVVAEGLRVLYVSPEFRALSPEAQATAQASSSGIVTQRRVTQGAVNLAVPVDATVVSYVFADAIGAQSEVVSLLELLPALDHASDIQLSLFLEPEQPDGNVYTSGLYVPELVKLPGKITPQPTPTATPTP